MAPRRIAGGCNVLGANGFVNGDMLGLNLAQIADTFGLAAAGDIEDLAGNDEIAQKLKKLGKVAIVDAAKNRQVEPEVGVHGVAAGLDFGLDRPQGGLDLCEVVTGPALRREPGGFDLEAHAQLEDLQHVLDGFDAVRIDPEWPPLHVGRHECAQALAGDDQTVGSERRHGLAHHGAADAGG